MNGSTARERLLAAIGYLWIFCFVPLHAAKDSPFVQFHGKQGFLLFVISLAFWILSWLPVIGWVIFVAGMALLLLLSLLGVMHALKGKAWEMPVIGNYAKKIEV